jgi:alanine dehydrogenase
MNIGVLRESNPLDRRVALTPPVVRQLVEHGNRVWVETHAGDGAMFRDEDYIRAGAEIAYKAAEVLRRGDVVVKISVPTVAELDRCRPGAIVMAFYHMAVAGPALFEKLVERKITAIGCELIQTAEGKLPVLAAVSAIGGQMTVPLAAHLLRSSSGGRGIMLGGSPGVPPAHFVVLGAGTAGSWAACTALAAGARVTVLDIDTEKLRRVMERRPNIATLLSDRENIAAAVRSADVVIGAVLVPGSAEPPHVVTKAMVESMRPGSVIIDLSIDQGGCVETSRPTTILEPTFVHHGIVHYCVPNLTADMGHSTSIAVAHALMPYLIRMGEAGPDVALMSNAELASGVYTCRGACVNEQLAAAWKIPHRALNELLLDPIEQGSE